MSWISNLTNLKKIQLGFRYDDCERSGQQDIQLFLGDIATILTSPHILILERDCKICCHIFDLLDIVNALGTMKNLQILDCATHFSFDCYCTGIFNPTIGHPWMRDEQKIKQIVEKAMKTIDEKLPNETVSIEVQYWWK